MSYFLGQGLIAILIACFLSPNIVCCDQPVLPEGILPNDVVSPLEHTKIKAILNSEGDNKKKVKSLAAIAVKYFKNHKDKDMDAVFSYILFKKIYELGFQDESCCYLGEHFYLGSGVEKNFILALRFNLRGSMLGNTNCKKMVAKSYILGQGCKEDYERAMKYAESVAKTGDTDMQLCVVYLRDKGVTPENNKAANFYLKAAAKISKDPDAKLVLSIKAGSKEGRRKDKIANKSK